MKKTPLKQLQKLPADRLSCAIALPAPSGVPVAATKKRGKVPILFHKTDTDENSSLTFRMLYILAIFMIVDGHIGHSDYLDLNGLLRYQNYHIALFIFASGYFLNLNRPVREFFLCKIKRLIIPMLLWNLFYGCLCFYLNTVHGFSLGGNLNLYNLLYAPFTDGHQFIYNMASWFLVPLFLVQCTGFLLLRPFSAESEKHGNITRTVAVIFWGLSMVAGWFTLNVAPENHGERTLILTALRMLYFLPAFSFGFFYRQVLEKYDRLNTPLYMFLLLSSLTVLTCLFPAYDHIPSWLDAIGEPALVIYAISFLAILFWLRIARILAPLVKKSSALMYISKHTFDIMMHHFAGFMLVKAALVPFMPNSDASLKLIKSNIWYYPFPNGNEAICWIYIAISMVIALTVGFTSRKICAMLYKI